MAVGIPLPTNYSDGDVWSASDVNDITGTINTLGGGNFAAGKNKIINGDLFINQRAFSSTTTNNALGFDRFKLTYSGGTTTMSAQTFTAGTAPVSGYEARNFVRAVSTSQSVAGDYSAIRQAIEDVRTLAGQTATVSFWAKASTGTPNIGVTLAQNFGTSGSSTVPTSAAVKTLTTSWARYTFTIAVPSISGKTISTINDHSLDAWMFISCGTTVSALGYAAVGLQNVTVDIWGVQVEAGSTATAFQTATGTIQGELAACQRYYVRFGAYGSGSDYVYTGAWGGSKTSTSCYWDISFPVQMRGPAKTVEYSNLRGVSANDTAFTISSLVIDNVYTAGLLSIGGTWATTGLTTNAYYKLQTNGSVNGYLAINAEL